MILKIMKLFTAYPISKTNQEHFAFLRMYQAKNYRKEITPQFNTTIQNGEGGYNWYSSLDGSYDDSVLVAITSEGVFTTDIFLEKEIYYYYCVYTSETNDTETFPMYKIAYTGMPILSI